MQTVSPFDPKRITQMALYVLLRPRDFFRTMPRSGSLSEPIAFIVMVGLLAVLISLLIGVVFMGQSIPSAQLLSSIIITPVMFVGATFVSAGVLWVIWKLLGSKQSYNVSFRCSAATMAIAPITALLGFVPLVAMLTGVLWTMILYVIASTEVHGIGKRKATIAFALMGLVLMGGIWMMQTAMVLGQNLERMGLTPAEFQQMSPQQREEVIKRMSAPHAGQNNPPVSQQ